MGDEYNYNSDEFVGPGADLQDMDFTGPPSFLQDNTFNGPPSFLQDNSTYGPPSFLQDNQFQGPPSFLQNGSFDGAPIPEEMDRAPEGWQAPALDSGENAAAKQMPDFNWNPNMNTGAQSVLANLFNGQGGSRMLAALLEGQQNKKGARLQRQSAQQLQPMLDPFGSQRAQYQQLLSQTYSDPNVVLNRPEIAAQLQQMRQSMDAKDAAAGRRSQYGSREIQLAQQSAGLVDKYRQQLAALAGSQYGPNGGTAAQMQNLANLYDVNGYTSPIASAVGNIQQTGQNQELRNAILQRLSSGG